MQHPVIVTLLVTGVLLGLAVPTLNMRLGIDLGIGELEDTPVGEGQQILTEEFAPGFLSSIRVVYTSTDGPLTEDDLQAISRLHRQTSQDSAVAEVTSLASTPAPDGACREPGRVAKRRRVPAGPSAVAARKRGR